MTKKEARKAAKSHVKMLVGYRTQLLARHQQEPLKSPPLFLLDAVISGLSNLAANLK